MTEHGNPVDARYVHRVSGRMLRDIAGFRVVAMAAPQRADGGTEPGFREVCERCEHASVDLARADVVAATLVDLDAVVREHSPLELSLREQQDLADRLA